MSLYILGTVAAIIIALIVFIIRKNRRDRAAIEKYFNKLDQKKYDEDELNNLR
jgi:preprotein translocase subunit YajC